MSTPYTQNSEINKENNQNLANILSPSKNENEDYNQIKSYIYKGQNSPILNNEQNFSSRTNMDISSPKSPSDNKEDYYPYYFKYNNSTRGYEFKKTHKYFPPFNVDNELNKLNNYEIDNNQNFNQYSDIEAPIFESPNKDINYNNTLNLKIQNNGNINYNNDLNLKEQINEYNNYNNLNLKNLINNEINENDFEIKEKNNYNYNSWYEKFKNSNFYINNSKNNNFNVENHKINEEMEKNFIVNEKINVYSNINDEDMINKENIKKEKEYLINSEINKLSYLLKKINSQNNNQPYLIKNKYAELF